MIIGVVSNLDRDIGGVAADKIISKLLAKGVGVRDSRHLSTSQIVEGADYVIAIGGDGTMLAIISECAKNSVPVVGINFGNTGFLTEAEASETEWAVEALLNKNFRIAEKTLICAEYNGKTYYALNEVVVSRNPGERIITLDIFADGNFVDKYVADGFIVCTPTGSTAYSLSAGGPVLSPDIRGLALTPVCPHSLRNKSVVVSDESSIAIKACGKFKASVIIDGKIISAASEEFTELSVKKAPFTAKFIRLREDNFYKRLFDKLNRLSIPKE